MRLFSLCGLLAIPLLGACAAETVEPEARSAAPIIGGTTDTGHPSVGLVRAYGADGSGQLCTGTLVAPRVVLTAGHCAYVGNGRAVQADISYDAQPNIGVAVGTNGFTSGTIIPHPSYDGDPNVGHDVSVIVLSTAPNAPVTSLGASPAAGSSITAVGYGRSSFGTGDQPGGGVGLKRMITIPVDAVTAHEFTAGSDGQGTCHGDSGGPELQGGAVVGVTSYGSTADCHGIGHYMRVDDNLSFLDAYVSAGGISSPPPPPTTPPPPGAGSHACSISVECVNGACACGDGPNAGAACDGQIGSANSCAVVCESCN